MKEPRFIYVRNSNKTTGPAMTIAWRMNEQRTDVDFGVSFCSKKDRFNKKIGREIARGRLDTGKCDTLPVNPNKPELGKHIYSVLQSDFNAGHFNWDKLCIDFPASLSDVEKIKVPTLQCSMKWTDDGVLSSISF